MDRIPLELKIKILDYIQNIHTLDILYIVDKQFHWLAKERINVVLCDGCRYDSCSQLDHDLYNETCRFL